MEVYILFVGAQQVLHINRYFSVNILDEKLKLVHRNKVGLSPVEPHEVFTLEQGPNSFLAVELTGIGWLKQRSEVLVESGR